MVIMIAQKHQDQLKRIKDDISQSAEYFQKNVDRYKEFIRFVYKTSLTDEDIANLEILQKPTIEFNVLEAYINRLIGDFQENEPDISVSAADGVPVEMLDEAFLKTLSLVESHTREVLDSSKNDGLRTKLMRDMLAGGFSVAKIYTDYVNETSFEQNIFIKRVFDPTLTGFDPMARDSHKGDGRYCFEIIPRTKEEFIDEFGEDACKGSTFTKSIDGKFNWSYKNKKKDIVLVVDFYEKTFKKEKIVKLSNGATVLKKHYQDLVDHVNSQGIMAQAPIILEERMTKIQKIVRYRLCENKILDYSVTDYNHLPLVFFDGNGIVMYDSVSGSSQFMTRPYVYHAKGIQKLKNFAGQTVANEIENMKMTQWKAPLEGMPEKYMEGYLNPQKAQTIVYYAYSPDEQDKALPPPMEVQRTPTPEIVLQTFTGDRKSVV